MCGILGIATGFGRRAAEPGVAERMRDTMARRGPDDSGLLDLGHVVLAHRRLAVIDLTPTGHQPMAAPDGSAIVYNGELYNDAELRRDLAADGFPCHTPSDTETVLNALRAWGPHGVPRLRGMYAFGFYSPREGTIVLARDPLGIKPLYFWVGQAGDTPLFIFASEPRAILAHPAVPARPDLVTVSAYLSTIRTVLGERTLFEGISIVPPGKVLWLELTCDGFMIKEPELSRPAPSPPPPGDAAEAVRVAVRDSVARHLRSDVPICCLLSGGLDSSIIASGAIRRLEKLHTYCSGDAASGEDFAFAREVAAAIGSQHIEVPVTREMFRERWGEMIDATGLPLSTPNEVAINEVARRLRADGRIVTLSGEGADELFGGYEAPMLEAARYEREHPGPTPVLSPGSFQLLSNAWIPPNAKPAVLNEPIWKQAGNDADLVRYYDGEFTLARQESPDDSPLQAHLRFHRRINLAGLLQRLDTATMLAGVEGRTPFADSEVARLAESLPMSEKFRPGPRGTAPETKRVLRRAFGEDLPASVVARPKASFPLPFQEWVADRAECLRTSSFAKELFTAAAIETVARDPRAQWRLAWPMINLAMWGDRWWR